MTRDCKSLGFGLRRFESYFQHHFFRRHLSSVGQSSRLVSGRSSVRIRQMAPDCGASKNACFFDCKAEWGLSVYNTNGSIFCVKKRASGFSPVRPKGDNGSNPTDGSTKDCKQKACFFDCKAEWGLSVCNTDGSIFYIYIISKPLRCRIF